MIKDIIIGSVIVYFLLYLLLVVSVKVALLLPDRSYSWILFLYPVIGIIAVIYIIYQDYKKFKSGI